jgi:hypothetical protein
VTRPPGLGMLRPMRARVWLGWCWLLGAFSCVACNSGTETGNPSITGALSYTGYSSKPTDYGVRDDGAVATITNAWLDLDSVNVSPDGACGIDVGEAFLVPALGVGDHAAGQHNSTAYAAKAGSFCSVGLPFARVSATSGAANLPDELRGNSLLLTGKLADGTPFSIASSATPLIELRAGGSGFVLSPDQSDVVIAFDFAAWLDGVDFAAADRLDGQVVISSRSNPDLLAQFEENVASGIALFRDRDGDGLIDTDAELLARGQ